MLKLKRVIFIFNVYTACACSWSRAVTCANVCILAPPGVLYYVWKLPKTKLNERSCMESLEIFRLTFSAKISSAAPRFEILALLEYCIKSESSPRLN